MRMYQVQIAESSQTPTFRWPKPIEKLCMPVSAENHFLFQQECGEVTSLSRHCWIASVFSQRSPTKSTPNEDATAVISIDEETAVFAVADGCGGMRGGEQASSVAIHCLAESLNGVSRGSESMGGEIRMAILEGIENANRSIQNLRIGAACTLAVAEFHRGVVRTYHVGDSVLLLMSNRGKIRYQSICHSPVGFAVEAGFLEPSQAMHHEERHVVSNIVGDPRMRIEMGPTLEMAARDTLLLASDGLFDNLTTGEVVSGMRTGRLASKLKSLTDLALARMAEATKDLPSKPDDLSVIGIRRST